MAERTTTLADIAAQLQELHQGVRSLRLSSEQLRDALRVNLVALQGIEGRLGPMKEELATVVRDALKKR